MTKPLLALLLCFAAAGCGETTLDADDVEKNVRSGYEKQTALKLDTLECDEAKAEVGAKFGCEGVNSSDVELTIRGTVRKVDGDSARYRWDVVDALAPGRLFAEEAKRRLEESVGQKAQGLTCPERVRVKAGATVRCELTTMDGERYGATLTIKDAKGAFDIEVDQTASSGS